MILSAGRDTLQRVVDAFAEVRRNVRTVPLFYVLFETGGSTVGSECGALVTKHSPRHV